MFSDVAVGLNDMGRSFQMATQMNVNGGGTLSMGGGSFMQSSTRQRVSRKRCKYKYVGESMA